MFHQFSDRECLTFDPFSKGLSITKGAKLIPPLPARKDIKEINVQTSSLLSILQHRREEAMPELPWNQKKLRMYNFSIISLLIKPSPRKSLEVQKDKTLKMGMTPWITNNHRIFFFVSLNLLPDQNLIWPNLTVLLEILTSIERQIKIRFWRQEEENNNKKKSPAFSLSLYHSFLIKQLSSLPGLSSDHIPGSEGKTHTKKKYKNNCLEGNIWLTDISWSNWRKEPVWASQVTSRQLRHRCRKNIELWGIIRFIFFNK